MEHNVSLSLRGNAGLNSNVVRPTPSVEGELIQLINKFHDGKITLAELTKFLGENKIPYQDDGNVLKFTYNEVQHKIVHNTKNKQEERDRRIQEDADRAVLPETPNNAREAVILYPNVVQELRTLDDRINDILNAKKGSIEKALKEALGEVDEKIVEDIMDKMKKHAEDYFKKYPNGSMSTITWELQDILEEYVDNLVKEKEAREAEEQKAQEEEAKQTVLPDDYSAPTSFFRSSATLFQNNSFSRRGILK